MGIQSRFEQIISKIELSKVISLNHLYWYSNIDEKTLSKFRDAGYVIEQDFLWDIYLISW